jgi:predicted PurR-regulated permease PerM
MTEPDHASRPTPALPPVEEPRTDLPRATLGVLCIGGLILAAFWVLKPFIGAAIWAAMIVVATWPLLMRVQERLWNRRAAAVAVMSLALLVLFVLPVMLIVITLVQNATEISAAARQLSQLRMPTAPDWLAALPLVGERIRVFWETTVAAGTSELWPQVQPYATRVAGWLLKQVGSVGLLLAQGLLIVAIAAVMYAQGEIAASGLVRFGRRLAGAHGEDTVVLVGQAIRGVALGVGVTAVVQSTLGGIGLAVAGVPYAGLLSGVMLVLCLAQVGPVLVMVPAVVWLFAAGDNGWGIFLAVVTLIVSTLDNFLRPMLIRMGADLPLLLIFVGVIGGLLAFGLVGIFVGPVVLAVVYTLLKAWVREGEQAPDDEPPQP